MKSVILCLASCAVSFGQNSPQGIHWAATTGDVSLTSAGTTATVQQPATNASNVFIDQIVVYCAVACSVTQAANGTAATTTAGTVTPILPTPLSRPVSVNFFTASNVGSGTAQGGAIHLPAGATVTLCLSPHCGSAEQVTLGTGGGTATNYSTTISSISGVANITFYGRL